MFLLPELVTTQERSGTVEGNHNGMKTQQMSSSAEPLERLLLGDHSLLACVTGSSKDVLTSCNHGSHGLARGSRLVEICLVSLKSVANLPLTSLRPPSRHDT